MIILRITEVINFKLMNIQFLVVGIDTFKLFNFYNSYFIKKINNYGLLLIDNFYFSHF